MAFIYLCTADPRRGTADLQEQACREYATKWSLPVTQTFHDTIALGPAFTDLLEAVTRDGETDVIISEIATLGRVAMPYLEAEARLDHAGARLRPAREGYRPDLPTLYRSIIEAQREHNGPRIHAARRSDAERRHAVPQDDAVLIGGA